MTKNRIAVLSIITAGAFGFAGCGGDDGGSDTLSKADLAKKADAICVSYNAKQKALPDPTDAVSTIAYFDKLIPLSDAQGKELKDLKPADDVKAEWDGLIKDYDTIAATAVKARDALKGGDEAGFQKIVQSVESISTASDQKLDALGAPHCGSQSDN